MKENYLESLRGKIFKLLPMREARDEGAENHLFEYLDNLCSNCAGYCERHAQDDVCAEFIEAYCNIIYLKKSVSDSAEEIDFKKWRSIVLRSTRLIQTAIDKCPDKEV